RSAFEHAVDRLDLAIMLAHAGSIAPFINAEDLRLARSARHRQTHVKLMRKLAAPPGAGQLGGERRAEGLDRPFGRCDGAAHDTEVALGLPRGRWEVKAEGAACRHPHGAVAC